MVANGRTGDKDSRESCTGTEGSKNMEEKYLICEDSLEGIWTGIYEAYAGKWGHEHTHLLVGEEDNYRLFATYVNIVADAGKADKVSRTLRQRLGDEVYLELCRAAASCQPDKAEAVYKTVVDGITGKRGRAVLSNLRNPQVARVFELARNTANEAHFEIEFIRFRELENGILFSKIGPKNDVMTFVLPHFADRMPLENFMVYDENHGIFGVHPAKNSWFLAAAPPGFREPEMGDSENERKYQELFRLFHRTIGIQERENRALQRQMAPLRYQEYMMEFSKK